MPDCLFKFPPCFSTVYSILDDPGRGKRYVTQLNELSHLLSYFVHALSVPCFLMGSSLGNPCFVTLDSRNVTATSVSIACGTVALHCRPTSGRFFSPACSNGYTFTSTAVTSQHLSYLPGLFPQPVVFPLLLSTHTWFIIHLAANIYWMRKK